MFRKRDVVCAIEFGTSKICALLGEVGSRGEVANIIGMGAEYAPGAVVKGDIADMERATEALSKALEKADRISGGELVNCPLMTVLVSGCGIESRQSKGIVTVKNADGVITRAEIDEANENAKVFVQGSGREIINTSASYFLVDNRRVSNPLHQSGRQLEARVHVIHALSSRIENYRSVIANAGVESANVEPVFSPLAAGFGIVGELEKENGSLLIDIGAGTTDYLVHFDRGIYASGVIPLGLEHVANDLSIGLKLHIDTCRRILESGQLENAQKEKLPFLEFTGSAGKKRQIPVSAFEMIADARLREIFELVRRQLKEKDAPRALGAGGILTGGGAEYFRCRELFSDIFDLDCRIGLPSDAVGVELDSPRFSAIWGALKVAAYFYHNLGVAPASGFTKLISKVSKFLGKGE